MDILHAVDCDYLYSIPVCCLVSGLTTRGVVVVEVVGTILLVVGAGVLVVVEVVGTILLVVGAGVLVAAAVVGTSHCWVLYEEKKWDVGQRQREGERDWGGGGGGGDECITFYDNAAVNIII